MHSNFEPYNRSAPNKSTKKCSKGYKFVTFTVRAPGGQQDFSSGDLEQEPFVVWSLVKKSRSKKSKPALKIEKAAKIKKVNLTSAFLSRLSKWLPQQLTKI